MTTQLYLLSTPILNFSHTENGDRRRKRHDEKRHNYSTRTTRKSIFTGLSCCRLVILFCGKKNVKATVTTTKEYNKLFCLKMLEFPASSTWACMHMYMAVVFWRFVVFSCFCFYFACITCRCAAEEKKDELTKLATK